VSPVDRSRLPSVGPARPFRLPEIRKQTLDNGLELRAISHRDVPVVSVSLVVRGGSAADPEVRPGLTAITADLLDEGTSDGLDALGVADRIAGIGGELDVEVGFDATVLTLTMLGRFLSQGLDLLAAIVCRPTLSGADFDRVRALRLERLRQLRDHPAAVAERAFAAFLYGTHPYGHLSVGTEASLEGCTNDEVRAFYRATYHPSRTTLVAAGDFSADSLMNAVRTAFAGWHAAGDALAVERDPGRRPPPPAPTARLAVVPRTGAAQSELRIGHVTVSRDTPDYHALLVLNSVLGGQFVSRINLNLREKRGYTYGARTGFDLRRGRGPFVLQTSVDTRVTADAIRESLAEIADIRGSRPPTDEELAMAKASLTRGYARGFETGQQIARAVAQLSLHELPDTYFETFVPRIEAVDHDEVRRVARTHLDPDRMAVVVVGDVERAGPALADLTRGQPRVLSV
jgi:predicted Zn-dependent peptidase